MAADESYVRRSVKELAAGLNPGEVGRAPITAKPIKPTFKPKVNLVGSASVAPGETAPFRIPNQPAAPPEEVVQTGIPANPASTRKSGRPPPPRVPPRRETGDGKYKPPVPSVPPRCHAESPGVPSQRLSEASSVTTDGTSSEGPIPTLPPRRPSDRPDLPERRASQASIASTPSAVSSVSKISAASRRPSGTARTPTSEQPRIRAPAYDPATLPSLPPKRGKSQDSLPPLPVRGKSTSVLGTVTDNEAPPPALPTRPGSSAPSMPARPASAAPAQPPRRLPPAGIPPVATRPDNVPRSANGFDKISESNDTYVDNADSHGVIELDANNFDSVVLQPGRPALVDFSANFCKYCKELDPIYDKLGDDFKNTTDQLVFARVDCAVHTSLGERFEIQGWPTIKWFDGSGGPPEIYPYQRTYEAIANFIDEKTGLKPNMGQESSKASGRSGAKNGAPPVPHGTRPNLAELNKTKPKAVAARSNSTSGNGCLLCRDFSGPDSCAANLPRQRVRSLESLAHDLTSPFPTATEKARAIFTWMHHNVAYDCPAFFGNRVRNVSPEEVLRSGLAVCSGYAGLYADLAQKAGLECKVIGGHGKGFGYKALEAGERVPPESQGHAWNAVKIDHPGSSGMYWKLIDACWGAGNVNNQTFNKAFSPHEFTRSNDVFGRTHFPQDRRYQHRSDGRTISWEEYYVGDAGGPTPQVFSNIVPREGLSGADIEPKLKDIPTNPQAHSATNGIVRFLLQRVCLHWNPEVNGAGKDLIYVLATKEGDNSVMVPFETNGTYWWCDVHVSKLGKKGDDVNVWAVDTIDGQSSRGMSSSEYQRLNGKKGQGWSGVAVWNLV